MNISFNNHTPEDFGAWLANIPVITPSDIKQTISTIPMRDGELYGVDEYRGNATIELLLHMRSNTYMNSIREVRRWMHGSGTLTMTDNPGATYEVVVTKITELPRLSVDYGRVAVEMVIYPYEFLNSGNTPITSLSITNDYDTCKPLFDITGTGGATGTLSVSGGGSLSFKLPTAGQMNIDIRLKKAYRGNASLDYLVQGNYDKMVLKHGTNTISISSGFTVKTTPRWGYYI